jgi:hypothetical protein
MREGILKVLTAAMLVGLSAASAEAQTFRPPDPLARPWSTARINIKGIYFSPTFELRDVGVDDNVFNDEENPKSDITGTLGMRSLVGIHFGEGLVFQVEQANDYHYYRRYRSERSVDNALNFVLELRTAFFRPWVRWTKTKTSQRSGYEIDERAEKRTPTFDFGGDINAFFRLGISGAAKRTRVRFKDTEVYDGQNLSEALDQTDTAYQGFVRYQLTEFTDVLAGMDYTRDRFEKSPIRNNDSYYYYAGIRTKEGAVFTGNATAGWREQRHNDPAVPGFKGVTASVDLALRPSERVQLQANGGRDLGYSYLIEYPYIIDSGVGGEMTIRLAEHFDTILSGRSRWLDYDETVTGESKPYTERTVVLGAGAGYFIGGTDGTRIGFLVEQWRRTSPVDGRSFRDTRISSNYRFSF